MRNKPTEYVMRISNYICLLIVLIVSGCQAEQHAQSTARLLVQYTTAYQDSVDKKIAAERKFYQDEGDNLSRVVMGFVDLSATKSDQPFTSALDPTKTVFYGAVETRMLKDAYVLAEKMAASESPPFAGDIIGFITSGVESERAFYEQVDQRRVALETALAASLEKIDAQDQHLKAARDQLNLLTQRPSDAQQLSQIIAFGKEVDAELSKSKTPGSSSAK